MPEEKIIKDRYIGDGVYASFDGWHIWLDLRGQGDRHIRIALEPSVMDQLKRFEQDAFAERNKANA